ncbi:MAG: hypothetical protein Q7T04_03230, partial [Dehalococcoidia bacterium]|nr:hypothetical protein [Dehalococcoidia bacterium]
TLTQDSVSPGETFYADLETEITWLAESTPPFPLSALMNFQVTPLYQIVAVAKGDGSEHVLGASEMTIGPFRNVKAGDKFKFQQHIALVFPVEAQMGDYTVIVRPVGLKGMMSIFWGEVKGMLPQEYALGSVGLAAEQPTPTPTPTPAPQPTPTPVATVAPAPSPTPLFASTPTAPTATPAAVSPTPTPEQSSPPQDAYTGKPGWLASVGVAVWVLTFAGLIVGASLNRRLQGPKGR